MTTRVTLFIPGLLGMAGSGAMAEASSLPLPALETLVARARRHAGIEGDGDGALLALFGLSGGADEACPVAGLTGLCDGIEQPTDGLWLRADPVHLAADRDRVVMTGYDTLAVSPAEAEQLVAAFNGLFGEDGLVLHAPTPMRWYLRVPQPPNFTATAVAEVVGQDIDPHLPRGAEAMAWHRLLNEVQMLFYGHSVNQRRQQEGQLPVNSLWLWGGGALPESLSSPWATVWSNNPLGRGLAEYCKIGCHSLPPTAGEWLESAHTGAHLVVMEGARHATRSGDIPAWRRFVEGVEQEWMAPLLGALKSGRVSEIQLLTGNGQDYRATVKNQRRWWRRRRSIFHA